jgi:hypothetical protein
MAMRKKALNVLALLTVVGLTASVASFMGGYNYLVSAVNAANSPAAVPGTWAATDSLVTAREQHTATVLDNGKVLVAEGRYDVNSTLAIAELYTPPTAASPPLSLLLLDQ